MVFLNDDESQLLNLAFFYLKFRHRSKKEVRDYLLKKIKTTHWSPDSVEKILERLEELKFINDQDFVRWFVEQRNLMKPKSVYILKQELFQFGIDKQIVDEYFENNIKDEDEVVFNLLSRKWSRYSHLDKQKRFEKAMSFLMRRGFSYDVIKKIINRLEENS
ncbi:MAG: regulatory protein RecX [bacterium]|nr:regulatory protein RecX [bacterium]